MKGIKTIFNATVYLSFIARPNLNKMSSKSILLQCYWDGRISHGTQGITYHDAISKAIEVNRGVKYSELIEEIYNIFGIDCHQYKLKIVGRYLAHGQYIALPVDNDASVNIMLDMTNSVELYIEKSDELARSNPSPYIHLNVRTSFGIDRVYKMERERPLQELVTAFVQTQGGYRVAEFSFRGHKLDESKTPNEYHMVDGDLIYAAGVSRSFD